MKTVIIVQARMGSTRLPGKILKEVLNKTLLEYQIERLQRVRLADAIVIATTTKDTDKPIINLCNNLSIACFRCAEQDVLARYYSAANTFRADIIVRITSDCPIIDPQVIDEVIKYYSDHYAQFDFVSNTLQRTYPRGMDTEVFPFRVLSEAFKEAKASPEREHVTPFIRRNPQRYRLGNVTCDRDLSQFRWTVDTPEDFELIRNIITTLYPVNPYFGLKECLTAMNKHPEWKLINSYVAHKVYGT